MRKDITVAADPRESRGKNAARQLRMAGKIPAVVYGAGKDSVAVSVSPKEINKILLSSTGHNTIFDVAVGAAEKTPAMIVDWLHDPIKGNLLHIDLMRIDLTKKLRVKVPVHTHGDPHGVKVQGGMFEIITREIEIECLPDEIPERFDYDVSEMNLGQSLRASQIPLTPSMKLMSPGDAVVAHVVAIRTTEEAAAVTPEGEAKAEPEVVKKGKKEEEGASDDKGKKK